MCKIYLYVQYKNKIFCRETTILPDQSAAQSQKSILNLTVCFHSCTAEVHKKKQFEIVSANCYTHFIEFQINVQVETSMEFHGNYVFIQYIKI